MTPRTRAARAPGADALRAAYVAAIRRYFGRDEVHGIAVGVTYKAGRAERHPGLRVHVREKIAPGLLAPHLTLPRRLQGVRLDVTDGCFVDDACPSFAERTARSALIQPGLSVGRRHGPAGTIGALVEDAAGRRFVLGAGHVFVGDQSSPGDDLFQPAEEDGASERIAALARFSRVHDTAVAEIDSSRPLRPRAVDSAEGFAGVELPRLGQVLRKSGRSSCLTLAQVEAIGAFQELERVVYLRPIAGAPDDGRICRGGDSGAVWFDPETSRAVALHVKGEDVLGSRAIAVLLASEPSAGYVSALDMWGLKIL